MLQYNYGFIVSLAKDTISKDFRINLLEIKYYPLAWLTMNLNYHEYVIINFALFFIIILLITFLFIEKILLPRGINLRSLLFPIFLFIPTGLIMDFIHELGHALFGIVFGGNLTYMKIAYFEIYPKIAINAHFDLGITIIDGLQYGSSAHGFMLIGGSITTNITSWFIALILLKSNLSNKLQISLKLLGLFGILDLPFYIFFPQIGLHHWIFLGGLEPEPLIGARMIGLHDSLFYLLVSISTFSLILIYSKTLRNKIMNIVKLF